MNVEYVKRALCFHGQPMQKIWETERDDLHKLNLPIQPNYDIYQARQRYFTFQDRAKRLKLHHFFARKADALYDMELQKYANVVDENHLEKVKPFFALLPPYELFAHKPNDKVPRRWNAILEGINTGDIMYGIVNKIVPNGPTSIKPLCTAEPLIRYLNHLPIKALILPHDVGPMPLEKDGSVRGYHVNDLVCCEVLRILIDVDRIFLAMTGEPKNPKIKFGLINREDLPLYYGKANDAATQRYEECLQQSRELLNPNYDVLFSINGLDVNDNFTLMKSLKRPFPEEELANNLRKSQANKWAFRAVAEGIERFKRGMHMEAFQCLNKALAIDPENVEGLVARGALFANRGSFQKAVDDFRTALGINPYHGNARKYMGETLVALGRSLEEDKRFEEAGKAYMDCLEIIPQHAQALECMERINQRTSTSNGGAGLLDNELLEHLISLTAPLTSTASPPTTSTNANDPLKKLEKASSSSEEDSSSDSDDSNSDADPSSNASLSTGILQHIPAHTTQFQKDSSMSPLSKRLALHAASLQAAAAPKLLPSAAIQYDQPFYYNLTQPSTGAAGGGGSNDFKLEDDDTATRVRKLLEEASQHKKAKKKKTKQKKNKKAKKIEEKGQLDMTDLAGSLFQNNYLQEAFKTVGSADIKQKLNNDISSYEQKIADIKNRQAKLRDSLSVGPLGNNNNGNPTATQQNSLSIDDSPPPPPSMKLPKTIPFSSRAFDVKPSETITSSSSSVSFAIGSSTRDAQRPTSSSRSGSTSKSTAESQKLSFQIRKPIKTDFFGMVRIATPLAQRSRSRSYSPSTRRDRRGGDRRSSRYRSKSRGNDRRHSRRSRSRTRSHTPSKRESSRRSRSRHRSRSRGSDHRRRSRHSRSYSPSTRRSDDRRSSRRSRYRSRSRESSRRHRTHSRSRSRSRSHDNRRRRRSNSRSDTKTVTGGKTFGNRVWQRLGVKVPGVGPWKHDKFEGNDSSTTGGKHTNDEDGGPTIEEIDEIINQAQRDRKAEIIKRDKDILKKPFKGRF